MNGAAERSIRTRNRILLVVLIVAVLAVIGYAARGTVRDWFRDDPVPPPHAVAEVEPPPERTAADPIPAPPPVDAERDALVRRWAERVGEPPSWPRDLADTAECATVEDDFERVCAALDRGASGGTCELLGAAAERLAERPPDPSSALGSYERMLANVTHLFRTLGPERLNRLRRVLDRERELAEPVALAAYRWGLSRPRCSEGASALAVEPLYDYATFLFTTVGGQAYLRRRPPEIEALTCFYALEIVEQADRAGHNPHGFDARDEIERCTALIDKSPLVFRERYVEALDAMARRWDGRASGR